MTSQNITTIGDKSIIEVDEFYIEIHGKHIRVYERGVLRKSLIFDNKKS